MFADSDRQVLDINPDLSKFCRSDRIRIRTHFATSYKFLQVCEGILHQWNSGGHVALPALGSK
jgi:hypothetical protein